MIDPKAWETLQEFKRRAAAALPAGLEAAYLFGSRARGDATAESDWDVALLTRGRLDWPTTFALAGISSDLLLRTGINISPTPLDPELYRGWQILSTIESEGLRL